MQLSKLIIEMKTVGALQARSSYLSINISVLLHSNYSTRSTQQLVAELEEITKLSVHQYHQEHEYNKHLALLGYSDTAELLGYSNTYTLLI